MGHVLPLFLIFTFSLRANSRRPHSAQRIRWKTAAVSHPTAKQFPASTMSFLAASNIVHTSFPKRSGASRKLANSLGTRINRCLSRSRIMASLTFRSSTWADVAMIALPESNKYSFDARIFAAASDRHSSLQMVADDSSARRRSSPSSASMTPIWFLAASSSKPCSMLTIEWIAFINRDALNLFMISHRLHTPWGVLWHTTADESTLLLPLIGCSRGAVSFAGACRSGACAGCAPASPAPRTG